MRGLPLLIPHRYGCADFPLPVLHGRASLTNGVTVTSRDSPVKKVAEQKDPPSFRSCQFSYPLSFRGQVCETQSSLPCCLFGAFLLTQNNLNVASALHFWISLVGGISMALKSMSIEKLAALRDQVAAVLSSKVL